MQRFDRMIGLQPQHCGLLSWGLAPLPLPTRRGMSRRWWRPTRRRSEPKFHLPPFDRRAVGGRALELERGKIYLDPRLIYSASDTDRQLDARLLGPRFARLDLDRWALAIVKDPSATVARIARGQCCPFSRPGNDGEIGVFVLQKQ